jgi:hypothetical protein
VTVLRAATAFALLLGAASAQYPTGIPQPAPQQPGTVIPGSQLPPDLQGQMRGQTPSPDQTLPLFGGYGGGYGWGGGLGWGGGFNPGLFNRFDPVWNRLPTGPAFKGFPVFPAGLSGYGNYPQVSGQVAAVPMLPAAEDDTGWPRWLRLREREPLPFSPESALLVRHGDRVWWRAGAEDAFIPLFYWAKLQALSTGAEVEVRQTGDFELLLHDSSRLISRGPMQVRIDELTPESVALQIKCFTWCRLRVSRRTHTIAMPDGSHLLIDPSAEGPDPLILGPALLVLERADEPGRYGGRARVFNAGNHDVLWRHALGETVLSPGHVVTMFLDPPASPIQRRLDSGGAAQTADGEAVRFDADTRADVTWSGARFEVGPGRSVRLDPVQGSLAPPPAGAAGPAGTGGPARTAPK